jgi:hypothetical protein
MAITIKYLEQWCVPNILLDSLVLSGQQHSGDRSSVESGGDGSSSRGAGHCWQREAALSIVIDLLTRSETGVQGAEYGSLGQIGSTPYLEYVTIGTGETPLFFSFSFASWFYYCILCGTPLILVLLVVIFWGPKPKAEDYL